MSFIKIILTKVYTNTEIMIPVLIQKKRRMCIVANIHLRKFEYTRLKHMYVCIYVYVCTISILVH